MKKIIAVIVFLFVVAVHDTFGQAVKNIYIVGSFMDGHEERACYWKNGERFEIESSYASANSITVANGKIFITSNSKDRACYWIDGTRTDLNPTNKSSRISDLTVEKGSVYCVRGVL